MSEIKARSAADYSLSMTEGAAKRVNYLMAQEKDATFLRVSVLGGVVMYPIKTAEPKRERPRTRAFARAKSGI